MPHLETLKKIPPQNMEAEQSLLGALLIDKDAIIKIGDILIAEDFYKETHKIIFEAMVELFKKHQPIDLLTLGNKLEEKGMLEAVGGRSYLTSLANTVPTSSHAVYYAKIIQKKSTLRRLLNAAGEITELGHNEDDDIEKTLDNAEQCLFKVSQNHLKQSFVPITDILDGTFDRIDEIHREKGKLRGVPTGFKSLDNLLAGFQRSDLIILAARPSAGKTSLALDFARNVSIRAKVPVGIFSLEMSKEQLVDRLLCAEAGVDLWKMRTGKLSDSHDSDDFPRIGHAMGVLSEAPIYIDDFANANIMQIRTKARRLQMEKNLGLIVIDYLQLMEGRSSHADNRVQEIAEISRSLKGIARELNVPVIALSQLSRAVEMRNPAIPKLSDLRESGSIEQDADVVMFIYRKAMDRSIRECPPDEKNVAELHIAKHRNGPTGIIRMFFDESKTSFKDLETKRAESAAPIEF